MKALILVCLSIFGQMASADPLQLATNKVKQLLSEVEVAQAKHYCTRGEMNCRTMYRTKYKATGKLAPIFYDTFYSASRQVGSTCYFIPSQKYPGKYDMMSDTTFDGKLNITNIALNPVTIIVVNAETGSGPSELVSFLGINSIKLGTTQYGTADMKQTESGVLLEGIDLDTANPDFKDPYSVYYERINR